ncbi:MAG: ribosome biogenesis factor YjgA [Gammaproteobacteria bacterium]
MTSNHSNTDNNKVAEVQYDGPSKSQLKRESHHLTDIGEEILKLSAEDIRSLHLPDELEEAVTTALKIKSRSGLKRQRLYIGKLLRSIDSETIESQLRKIQHRHDTNTAHFKRLEKWRDSLIDNDKTTLNEVILRYPEIDRQRINQLIRAAHQENQQNKPPAASRKLFKYLQELEDDKKQ